MFAAFFTQLAFRCASHTGLFVLFLRAILS